MLIEARTHSHANFFWVMYEPQYFRSIGEKNYKSRVKLKKAFKAIHEDLLMINSEILPDPSRHIFMTILCLTAIYNISSFAIVLNDIE